MCLPTLLLKRRARCPSLTDVASNAKSSTVFLTRTGESPPTRKDDREVSFRFLTVRIQTFAVTVSETGCFFIQLGQTHTASTRCVFRHATELNRHRNTCL